MTKDFLLMTIGSAGDVHPFVAVGAALKARGRSVTVAANDHFRPVIEGAGLGFEPLGVAADFERVSRHPDLWHPRRSFAFLVREGILPLLRPAYEMVRRRDPARTVVAASTLVLGARAAQEKDGYRVATVHLQPSVFMSARAPSALADLPSLERLPVPVTAFLLRAIEGLVLDRALAPGLNRFRAELGLPPVRRVFSRWIHSPWKVLGLFPDWYAPPAADWPPGVVLPGFVRFDRGEDGAPLDPALERFLADGPPPVVFTPGTANRQAARFFAASLAACRRTGRRGLFLTLDAAQVPPGLPPTVHHALYAPFSRVFPRAAAVVHHGGIGTTAQGLAAGVPQLVAALSHDQPDNARRLERLGVGAGLPIRRYDERRAAALLESLTGSAEVAARCRAARERVDFAGGAARACDALEA
jgi:rhamnosyltransferase subunit B